MPLPSNLVRVEARLALLGLIAARIADDDAYADLRGEHGVAVLYAYPNNHPARQIIAGDEVEGEVQVPVLRGPARQARTDEFDLKIVCGVGPGAVELDKSHPLDPGGFANIDRQVLRLVQLVDDVVATDPHLGGAMGPLGAALARLEGPNPTETNEGPGSAAVVTVHCASHHR